MKLVLSVCQKANSPLLPVTSIKDKLIIVLLFHPSSSRLSLYSSPSGSFPHFSSVSSIVSLGGFINCFSFLVSLFVSRRIHLFQLLLSSAKSLWTPLSSSVAVVLCLVIFLSSHWLKTPTLMKQEQISFHIGELKFKRETKSSGNFRFHMCSQCPLVVTVGMTARSRSVIFIE